MHAASRVKKHPRSASRQVGMQLLQGRHTIDWARQTNDDDDNDDAAPRRKTSSACTVVMNALLG